MKLKLHSNCYEFSISKRATWNCVQIIQCEIRVRFQWVWLNGDVSKFLNYLRTQEKKTIFSSSFFHAYDDKYIYMCTCTQMSRFSLYPKHANIIYIRWKSAFSSELTAQNIAYIALRLMANFNLPLVMYMNLWTFNISNESTWDIHFSVCFLRFCYVFILFLYLYLTAYPRLQLLFHFFSFQYTLSHSFVRLLFHIFFLHILDFNVNSILHILLMLVIDCCCYLRMVNFGLLIQSSRLIDMLTVEITRVCIIKWRKNKW